MDCFYRRFSGGIFLAILLMFFCAEMIINESIFIAFAICLDVFG